MPLNNQQALIAIVIMGAVTFFTRGVPFLLFGKNGQQPPASVMYLGKVLPAAIIALLVVYCYRNIDLSTAPYGLPQLIAGACAAALHIWKKNTLLSVFGGTALYMILLQIF